MKFFMAKREYQLFYMAKKEFARYLINRLPTNILDFSTSLESLFHEKLNYSGLRIFGCAC
jgi:hypothetical protein